MLNFHFLYKVRDNQIASGLVQNYNPGLLKIIILRASRTLSYSFLISMFDSSFFVVGSLSCVLACYTFIFCLFILQKAQSNHMLQSFSRSCWQSYLVWCLFFCNSLDFYFFHKNSLFVHLQNYPKISDVYFICVSKKTIKRKKQRREKREKEEEKEIRQHAEKETEARERYWWSE